jgi:hypothetical protein
MGVADGGDGASRKAPPAPATLRVTTGEVRAVQGAERVLVALDGLLSLVLDGSNPRASEAQVSASMGHVTLEARAIGLHPEEVIMLLKSAWRSRPHTGRLNQVETSDEQLTRLVTLSIKTYFSEAP